MSRVEAKARTRERLLDAAHALFAERGFNAVTIEDVVERAGYTRGAFYAHFADKAAIFWELADRENLGLFAELGEVAGAGTAASLEAAQAWFDRVVGRRPLARAFGELLAVVGTTDEGRARLAALFATERRMIGAVLQVAAEANGVTLPIPIEHLAALGLAIGNGLAQQHEADPDAVPTSLFGLGQTALWLGVLAYGETANTEAGDVSTGEHA